MMSYKKARKRLSKIINFLDDERLAVADCGIDIDKPCPTKNCAYCNILKKAREVLNDLIEIRER